MSITCPRCGVKNSKDTWNCIQCDTIFLSHATKVLTLTKSTNLNNTVLFSIIIILFGLNPLGFVSLYYSTKAFKNIKNGDMSKARNYVELANSWIWISFGSAFIFVCLWIILFKSQF